MICRYCNEEIGEKEERMRLMNGECMHSECELRAFIGSVAHQRKMCSCYISDSSEGDPLGMTLRQGALAAFAEWKYAKR